jgi:hypothetical protein
VLRDRSGATSARRPHLADADPRRHRDPRFHTDAWIGVVGDRLVAEPVPDRRLTTLRAAAEAVGVTLLGDAREPAPYLDVGPWDLGALTGDQFWVAPFGATLRYEVIRQTADPVPVGIAFVEDGLGRLGLIACARTRRRSRPRAADGTVGSAGPDDQALAGTSQASRTAGTSGS